MQSFGAVLLTAGAFAGSASIIAVSEAWQHYRSFTRPHLQKQVVRVLMMIPVYGSAAFLSLAFPVAGRYLETLRELYEALVVYAFTWRARGRPLSPLRC